MIYRRAFVASLIIGLLLPAPSGGQAQASRTYRVAFLGPFSTPEGLAYREAFFEAMRDLGYIEGRSVIYDVRTSDRDRVRVAELVDELIALKPDVLVSDGNAGQVLREKTTSIPIVLTASADPVGQGFAQSLRRPGMNVTGVSLLMDQLPGKHIDMMREIRPRLTRVGMLVDATAKVGCNIVEENAREAARRIGAIFGSYPVANRHEIELAFSQIMKERPDVLLPCPTALLFNNRDLLYENAVRLRIPFTSFVTASLPLGVLFAYSANFADGYRKAAAYVDKILRGARPGDLPFEQPAKFDLVINLKTAKAMGLTIPPSLLARADQVIE